ncbi:MAG: hypothetical protein M1823_006299 [Watsoniomyces obsoletus]|nr:MAG: hypothetical protein M1823_006299 [Watsoniomyces obsoletus]
MGPPPPEGRPEIQQNAPAPRRNTPESPHSGSSRRSRRSDSTSRQLAQMAEQLRTMGEALKMQQDMIQQQAATIERFRPTSSSDTRLPAPPADETPSRPRFPPVSTDWQPTSEDPPPPHDDQHGCHQETNTAARGEYPRQRESPQSILRPPTGQPPQSLTGMTTPSTNTKISYRKPPLYDGRDDPRYWLLEIEQDISREPDYFASDRTKVEYALRYLDDRAPIKRRFQRMLLQSRPDAATYDWQAFRKWCLDCYGATDPVLSAELGMRKLKYRSGQSI